MKKTLQVINDLMREGVIEGYAIGGATALLFYTEPALTFDVDIFVFLPADRASTGLVDLGPLYSFLASHGYQADKEHVMIEGIPVRFIPVYNPLVEEAVKKAVKNDYEGVETKVLTIEHLLAIMVGTNRAKDRERIGKLIDELNVDRKARESILKRHSLWERWGALVENK